MSSLIPFPSPGRLRRPPAAGRRKRWSAANGERFCCGHLAHQTVAPAGQAGEGASIRVFAGDTQSNGATSDP
jgi:hypothetical protein